MRLFRILYIVSFSLLLIIAGCSSSQKNSPISPDLQSDPVNEGPAIALENDSDRSLLGVWEININPDDLSARVTEARIPQQHFNVKNMILPSMNVKINSFVSGIVDADITLYNPSMIFAYDLRGIIFTDNDGTLLVNSDAWTPLYDQPGGHRENINPFRAFSKNRNRRIFSPLTKHTENFQIRLPVSSVFFAIDASFPANCEEPYSFENFHQTDLYNEIGSEATLSVDVLDWQNDVSEVKILAQDYIGETEKQFTNVTGDTWEVVITNNTGVGPGDYEAILVATSENSGGLGLYDVVEISITPDFNPIDITPDSLNFSPQAIDIDGNYAYIAANVNGLHIFDVSDPDNPIWIHRVALSGQAEDISVKDNYAYVVNRYGSLQIIECSSPETAYLINEVEIPIAGFNIELENDYAYVSVGGGSFYGLRIINISQPEFAFVEASFETPSLSNLDDFVVSDGFAYLTQYSDNLLLVIDVNPPDETQIVNSIAFTDSPKDISVSGNYAYVIHSDTIDIIDITDPRNADIINNQALDGNNREIYTANGFAYVWGYRFSFPNYLPVLRIYDLSVPDSPNLMNTVEISGYCNDVRISGSSAFLATRTGLEVYNIDDPEFVYMQSILETSVYVYDVDIVNDYAYLASASKIQVVDINPSDSAHIVSSISVPGRAEGIFVNEGYAYVAAATDGLLIISLPYPDQPELVQSVQLAGWANDIIVSDDYAYVVCYNGGLQIVDISTPENAFVANSIITPRAQGVDVSGGYAFVADDEDGLIIIDISSPQDAEIVNRVRTTGSPEDVVVDGDYAYIPISNYGLEIIDINPVAEAYIWNSVSLSNVLDSIAISDGFAYLSSFIGHPNYAMDIIDIEPPDSAHKLTSVDMIAFPNGFRIINDKAYVADGFGGLRIIDLW